MGGHAGMERIVAHLGCSGHKSGIQERFLGLGRQMEGSYQWVDE